MDKVERGYRLVMSVIITSALALSATVVGFTPTASAQAAPQAYARLGLGDRTIDTAVQMGPVADKAASLAGDGTLVGEAPGDAAPRKPTPVRTPAPAPRPATSTSRASSTTGWSTARVSWYGPGFYGNTMAGGGVLTPESMVVAHRTLSFGTKVQFEYNGRTCTAVVQDRGPFIAGRTFDLGPGVAAALGFGGVHTVRYRILGR